MKPLSDYSPIPYSGDQVKMPVWEIILTILLLPVTCLFHHVKYRQFVFGVLSLGIGYWLSNQFTDWFYLGIVLMMVGIALLANFLFPDG